MLRSVILSDIAWLVGRYFAEYRLEMSSIMPTTKVSETAEAVLANVVRELVVGDR